MVSCMPRGTPWSNASSNPTVTPIPWTNITSNSTVTTTGFDWTNVRGAVMVGRSLFYGNTDGFLYKRSFDGVNFEETRRALLWDLAERLSGPIGFEADQMSYSGWETLGSGSVQPVPRVQKNPPRQEPGRRLRWHDPSDPPCAASRAAL